MQQTDKVFSKLQMLKTKTKNNLIQIKGILTKNQLQLVQHNKFMCTIKVTDHHRNTDESFTSNELTTD